MSKQKKYWLITLLGTVAVSFYPLYMGVRVIYDMAAAGAVTEYDFPKYIIPYTPIALAVIAAVAVMPLILKFVRKIPTFAAAVFALAVFFTAELLFESKVIVTTTTATPRTTLESWQMFMCYLPPAQFETRQWTAVDVLMGEYSPTFKLHFYLISAVLIIAIINSIYGFAKILQTGEKGRCKVLTVQSVSAVMFLGLCILACFTAFFRNGEITVSPLSAVLMSLFFIVLGVTVGIFTGSFAIGKRKLISVWLPSAVASLVTLAMYIGEMCLLSGHLYKFGSGFIFDEIPGIVLAPADILVIIASGCVNAAICHCLNKKPTEKNTKI